MIKNGFINFLLLLVMVSSCKKDPEPVIVDIPDIMFLAALIEYGVDTDKDGAISELEAESVTILELNKNFYKTNGIEAFTSLERLICGAFFLDLSKNTLLKYLDCSGGDLSQLDISTNTLLEFLDCTSNNLTVLDVSRNTLLEHLDCSNNEILILDVSNCPSLKEMTCVLNPVKELNVSNNPVLEKLDCGQNDLTSLDVSNCSSLTELECYFNKLHTLDVTGNPDLQKLGCSGNQISDLDISKNISLRRIYLNNLPVLEKVCVWTMPFPPEGVTIDTTGSTNLYFTNECYESKDL